jgi:tetratricopeptide (TPR) repeat protein
MMGFFVALLAALPAQQPAKKTETIRPPWQRYLHGEDAIKAAEQEKQLAQLQEAGQWEEALPVAQAQDQLRVRAQGADHWQAIDARFHVEAIRRVLKASKEEQQSYRRALTMQREAAGLVARGRYREAQPLFEQVLAICRKVLGEEHPDTAVSYDNLALNQHYQGQYAQAERGFRKALAIRRKFLGEEHPDTAQSYSNLASCRQYQGKYKEAEEGLRQALAICRKVLGEEHLFLGIALCLGSVWALIPAGLASALLILRTRWEDETLQAKLPGYKEYAQRVRYKLFPGVW